MAKISADRKEELLELATEHLNTAWEWFDYHNWDGLIECDETLTDEELDWLSENVEVEVVLTLK